MGRGPSSEITNGGRRWGPAQVLRRMPFSLGSPLLLLSLAVGVHVAGRLVALRALYRFDTYYYSVAAYRLWQPGATTDDLIPDKPIGQPLLTGWCFRVAPGPPSRLVLVPIESTFMLAGYAVFAVLAWRLFGGRTAAALALWVVIAHNSYNAVNNVTDGFNLAESYLLLPMALAVLAHLTIRPPLWRGLIRGLGLGLAVSIKQTAIGLGGVLLVHGLATFIARNNRREACRGFAATVVGLLLVWLPILGFLHARGWLGFHLPRLLHLSMRQVESRPTGLPGLERFEPILPLIWWILLGLVAVWSSRRPAEQDGLVQETTVLCRHRSVIGFAALWLAVESAIIWILPIPASHHWQQMVVPTALLAGVGMKALIDRLKTAGARGRVAVQRWVLATTTVLTSVAAMPLLERAVPQLGRLDTQAEVDEFARWVRTWSPASAADHLTGGRDE